MPEDMQDHPGEASDDERSSLLAQLGQIHTEIKTADRHLDLDIPGYGGKLFARFRPYEVAKSERKGLAMARAARQGRPVVLASAIDTITNACEQLFVRNEKHEDLPIDPVAPVMFDKRLAQMLGFDSPALTEAAHVILELFPTQQSILAFSVEIGEWLNTAVQEADQEFLGK